jgi:AcrR family transcriptional regulator
MKSTDMRREREERRREGYREVILHAAERVILRKGYSALTMDDVAREAQLSKATVYKYVAGKGALLFEIMGHSFDDIRERFAGTVEGSGSAEEKLRRLVQVVLESGEDMKQINRILWMDKAMFRLMRVFAPQLGRAGAVPAADRKILAMLRQKRQELIDLGARILKEGVGRIPAHGHGPGRGLHRGGAPGLHAHALLGRGRPPRLRSGRRPDPIHRRRDPEPRTSREGELT